ncbi:cache domain-containing protein [Bacillus sp. AFS017274]|uniref:cache domain-containing protein n=1 Tax=Bacillaceae TaxID=186817 RepID=UPI000BFA4CD7|nr:cache domain-containing protein [Bacillus sp. AFS017274]PEZ76479.1 hypothetical protein CN380_22125 [Bacillus sp. AFS017274]
MTLKKIISLEINELPIRYKIIALLLIISIVPSIGFGSLISLAVDKIIEKQVTENTLQLIGQANKSLESYVENMQDISYFISMNPEVIDFLRKDENQETVNQYEIEQFLQAFTTVNPEIAGILLIDNKGNYISNELYPRNIHSLIGYKNTKSNSRLSKESIKVNLFSIYSCSILQSTNGCFTSLPGADQQLLFLCNYRGRIVP